MTVEVVRVENLTKSFTLLKQKSLKENLINASKANTARERFLALDDISFTVAAGESVGLVGPNGSGKSTLLKLIGGILSPSSGDVKVRGRVAALLELGAGFHPDLTGRENIYLNASILGLTRAETNNYFDEIVEFSGIKDFIDTQVKFYSSGMYVRLAFSVAVHVDPDILLVDEVLAVGDEPFQQKCMAKIRQFQQEGRTIVLVSHSAGQVNDVCNRAIVLEKGQIIEDSIPTVALGRLRRDYQGQMMRAQAAQNAPVLFSGRIGRTYLTDSHQSPHHMDFQVVMRPGSELRIHVLIEAQADYCDLGVAIESTVGQPMLSTSTKQLGVRMPPVRGQLELVVHLPDLQLGQGDYVVNLSLLDKNGAVVDSVPHAAMFAVRSAELVDGLVYTTPTIQFL